MFPRKGGDPVWAPPSREDKERRDVVRSSSSRTRRPPPPSSQRKLGSPAPGCSGSKRGYPSVRWGAGADRLQGRHPRRTTSEVLRRDDRSSRCPTGWPTHQAARLLTPRCPSKRTVLHHPDMPASNHDRSIPNLQRYQDASTRSKRRSSTTCIGPARPRQPRLQRRRARSCRLPACTTASRKCCASVYTSYTSLFPQPPRPRQNRHARPHPWRRRHQQARR